MCIHRYILFICVIVNCCAIGNVKGATSSAIPELLHDCYRSNFTDTAKNFQVPLSISMLVELIRKIELDDVNAFNMRILATSMLHGLKFDGIRRATNFGFDDSMAIPFRASGQEFYRYKLLVDYLTPGQSSLFPSDSLTTPQLCFLHDIISNSVDPWERGDESRTCVHQPSMPLDVVEEGGSGYSACPIKKGVVKTKWGPVSAGYIISAVSSALEESTVTFSRVQEAINLEENQNRTDDNPPAVIPNTNNVNNVWVSTLAGDIAEVILRQALTTPEIGNGGFWNDTLLPRVYYLQSDKWDLTEPEILGSIDALAISRYVKNSVESGSKTRLSQLIDMYYSERGIGNDKQYKATNRLATLARLLDEINLEEQVAGTAELLQKIGTYDRFFNEDDISKLALAVTKQVKIFAANVTKIYDNVEYLDGKQMKSPTEILVVLDGSYDPYTAKQMLYALSEAVQVSYYGSKVGVINGQSGNWMVNVTGELFQLFTDLELSQAKWPAYLSLGSALETIIFYYQNKTQTDCSNIAAKPLGKAIVIVSPDSKLTENDLAVSQRALTSIQKSYPDVSVIYVTSQENSSSISELAKNFRDCDRVVNAGKNVLSLVEQVSNVLSEIPGNIINFYCGQNQVRFEDYITPGMKKFYQIRKEYLETMGFMTNFSNSNYGDLSICAMTDYVKNGLCKDVTVNGEISFDSAELCSSASTCNIQFQVSSNTTNNLCVENDCRYRDQIRLNIITYKSSGYVPVFCLWHLIIIGTTVGVFR